MITKRIIACLDVRDGRVVKGVQFVDIVDAGDPAVQAARHALGVREDQLLILTVGGDAASKGGREVMQTRQPPRELPERRGGQHLRGR